MIFNFCYSFDNLMKAMGSLHVKVHVTHLGELGCHTEHLKATYELLV